MPRMMLPAATLSATVCATPVASESNSTGLRKRLDQPDLVIGERRIEPVDRLGQHRVAEAVDDVRELGDDARVDVGMVAVRHDEEVDVGLNLAGEVLEHEMLVLHLGAELGGLEQAFAVPDESGDLRPGCRQGGDIDGKPFVEEREVVAREDDFLGVLDQPVVLGVEDVVDGGQADVLIGAAVAGDEVGVEQLVVVDRQTVARVGEADFDVAVGEAVRDGVVGDVGEESRIDADGGGNADRGSRGAGDDDIVSRVRNAVGADAGNDLCKAGGIGDEIAVGVGAQQRHRADVLVGRAGCRASWPAP